MLKRRIQGAGPNFSLLISQPRGKGSLGAFRPFPTMEAMGFCSQKRAAGMVAGVFFLWYCETLYIYIVKDIYIYIYLVHIYI